MKTHSMVAARRQRATAPEISSIVSEAITGNLVIQRLQRRFGLSESVACLVARLASLGPQEGR